MASDINIKKTDVKPSRRGGLTLRILAVNVVAPLVLVVGLFYMGQVQESLVRRELETLQTKARLLAGVVEEHTADPAIPSGLTGKVLRRFNTLTGGTADFAGPRDPFFSQQLSHTSERDPAGDLILSVQVPVHREGEVVGTVRLTQDGAAVEKAMIRVRFEVLTLFLGTLSLTIFLSLYLAGVIGRPLHKLAKAADTVGQGRGAYKDIPDFSDRRDEIGDLSIAMREMTQALWERMDAIEHFAADVAHEIKNPLTSLRSAVETAGKVKNAEDREKLMEIIRHDVDRLDRLITDIANASRLDAELSRETAEDVDILLLLKDLVVARNDLSGGCTVLLEAPEEGSFIVTGSKGPLAQVFENLIGNALSFSPAEAVVTVRVARESGQVRIDVEDKGPGVPENKKDEIFERFYTERPEHEDYGDHSGLGLSIARQIVEIHKGTIFAENIYDETEMITGARFSVILPVKN